MPRGSNGTYTLPAGNPVVSGEVIQSAWANPTMTDLGNEITNSLDRYGRGGMLAPFKFIDGTAGAPSITFTNDPVLGIYRALQGDMRFVVDGADVFRVIAGKSQTWNGSSFADVLYQGGSPTFGAIGVSLGILLNNNTPIEAKTVAGVAHDVLWVNTSDQFAVGAAALPTYIHSSVQPVWFDGTANHALAALDVAQSWTGIQTFTVSAILANNVALYGKSAGGVAKVIAYIGTNDVLTLGDTSLNGILASAVQPRWHDGTNLRWFAINGIGADFTSVVTPNIYGSADPGSLFIDGATSAAGYLEVRASGGTTDRGWFLGVKLNNGSRTTQIRYHESEGAIVVTPTTNFDGVVRLQNVVYGGSGVPISIGSGIEMNGNTLTGLPTTAGTASTAAAQGWVSANFAPIGGGGGAQLDVVQTWTAIQTFQAGLVAGTDQNGPNSTLNGTAVSVNATMFTFRQGASGTLPVFGYLSNQLRSFLSQRNGAASFGDTRNGTELNSNVNPVWWNGTTSVPLAAVVAVALVNADGTVVKQRGFASITHTGTGEYAVTYPDFAGQGTLVALQRGTDGVRVVGVGGASSGTIETWVGAVKSDQPFLVMLLAI